MVWIAVDNSPSMQKVFFTIKDVLIKIGKKRVWQIKWCVFAKEVEEIESPEDIALGSAGGGRANDFITLLEIARGAKSIILISDGEIDEPPDEWRSNCPIFTVWIKKGSSLKGKALLEKIAKDTGGRCECISLPQQREKFQVFLEELIIQFIQSQVVGFVKELWKNEIIPLIPQEEKKLEKKCMENLKEKVSPLLGNKEINDEYIKNEVSHILSGFDVLKDVSKALILKSSVLKSALKNNEEQNLWIINATPIGIPLEEIIRDILVATKGELMKIIKTAYLFVDSEGKYDDSFTWGGWLSRKEKERKERCVVVSPIINKIEGVINYLSSICDIKEIMGMINLSGKEKLKHNGGEVEIVSLFKKEHIH